MLRYVLLRVLQLIPTAILASIVVFVAVRIIPGDPAAAILGTEATPEAVQQIREQMGLDRSIPEQYVIWLRDVLQGNFGVSWRSKQPATEMIAQKLGATVTLAAGAMLLALLISVPAGLLAAHWRGTFFDASVIAASTAGIAVPSFWIGMMLVLVLSIKHGYLPPGGYVPFGEDVVRGLRHALLPCITLAIGLAAPLTRFLRAGLIEALDMDYIRTARAKGLAPRAVLLKHALRNGLLSFITSFGLQVGSLLGGAVVTESVFNWPGIGLLLIDAVRQRDYAVVQAVILMGVLVFMAVNLLVDVSYALIHPRVRYESKG